MNPRIVSTTLLVLSALGCASTGPDDTLPYAMAGGETSLIADSECDESTPTYGEVAAFSKCVGCHSSAKTGAARKSAPADVNFDSKAAADEVAEDAAAMVRAGAMPPRSTGAVLSDAEKQQLYTWAECAM